MKLVLLQHSLKESTWEGGIFFFIFNFFLIDECFQNTLNTACCNFINGQSLDWDLTGPPVNRKVRDHSLHSSDTHHRSLQVCVVVWITHCSAAGVFKHLSVTAGLRIVHQPKAARQPCPVARNWKLMKD